MSSSSPDTANSVAAVELPRAPLERVFSLDRSDRIGLPLVWALAGALLVHVAGAAEAYVLATSPARWARDLHRSVAALLRTDYEIDLLKTPPPPPPPPEPEEEAKPDPAPAPRIAPAPKAATPSSPPPAAAQAGKILAQEPAADDPVDLTGETFVTGNADSFAGGVTANTGTSTTPVRNLNAQPSGVVGGTGKAPAAAPAATEDLSKPPSLAGSSDWDCAFPPESDLEQIDNERVPIVVTVGPDGRIQNVRVTRDPGHGFGRAAIDCALRHRLTPGLDRNGRPTTASLPLNVRFTR